MENDTTFTPGPWVYDLGSEDNRFEIRDQNYKPIAVITGQRGAFEANARLIAAAPDLYAALNALLDACYRADAAEDLSEEIDGSLLDAAGAALVKAGLMVKEDAE